MLIKVPIIVLAFIVLNGCATSTLWQEQTNRYFKTDSIVKNIKPDIRISPGNDKLHIIYSINNEQKCFVFTPINDKQVAKLQKWLYGESKLNIKSLIVEQRRLLILCDKNGGSSPLHDTDEIKIRIVFVPDTPKESEWLFNSSGVQFEHESDKSEASLLLAGRDYILDAKNMSEGSVIRINGNDKVCIDSKNWQPLLPQNYDKATLSITEDSLRRGYDIKSNGLTLVLRIVATPFTVVFDVVTFPIQWIVINYFVKI